MIKFSCVLLFVFFSIGIFDVANAQINQYEESPFGFHPASIGQIQNLNFNEAKNIGIRWHRPYLYAFWFLVQKDTSNSFLDWQVFDYQYGAVPEGMNIMANIEVEPRLQEMGYSKPGSYLPVDSSKYKIFVQALVERYDGDGVNDMPNLKAPVRYWQISNEINNKLNDYAEYQKLTYAAIKQSCPECQVVIGGVGGMPDRYPGNFKGTYLPILRSLDGRSMDIFDFHWYGDASGDYRKIKNALDVIKLDLTETGFQNVPIWVTEMGTYSGDPKDDPFRKWEYQTEQQQAGDLLKRFVYPLSLGIQKIFPAFGLREGFKMDSGYFDYTGLVYDDFGPYDKGRGVKKLGYYTYKLMTEKLEGSDWKTIQTVLEDTINKTYIYKFMKEGNPVFVCWWDYFDDATYTPGNTKQVILTGIQANAVKVTEAVPKYSSGEEVKDYSTAFQTDTLFVDNGEAQIILDENPVFIEPITVSDIEDESDIGKVITLFQINPNPINSIATIRFSLTPSLSRRERVTLKIFNLFGEEVAKLMDEKLNFGEHSVVYNTEGISGGVYFCRMNTGELSVTKKMIVVK